MYNDACCDCGARYRVSMRYVDSDTPALVEFRCNPCWLRYEDECLLSALIGRLTRNPALAAKVREVLGMGVK